MRTVAAVSWDQIPDSARQRAGWLRTLPGIDCVIPLHASSERGDHALFEPTVSIPLHGRFLSAFLPASELQSVSARPSPAQWRLPSWCDGRWVMVGGIRTWRGIIELFPNGEWRIGREFGVELTLSSDSLLARFTRKACPALLHPIRSCPPMYTRSASGIVTLPSSF